MTEMLAHACNDIMIEKHFDWPSKIEVPGFKFNICTKYCLLWIYYYLLFILCFQIIIINTRIMEITTKVK